MNVILADADTSAGTGFTIFLWVVGIYFAPLFIALARKHSSSAAIGALNFLLGWTFLGWVAALVWSLKADPKILDVRVTNPTTALRPLFPQASAPPLEAKPIVALANEKDCPHCLTDATLGDTTTISRNSNTKAIVRTDFTALFLQARHVSPTFKPFAE